MSDLKSSRKYLQWKSSLESNGIDFRDAKSHFSLFKKDGGLLFSLLEMEAYDPNGRKLLPIMFLRGDFVTIVTCLIDRETREEYFLLVSQRRVANGAIFYEHPAGMMDDYDDPYDLAIKEMEEETGLEIQRAQLHLMTDDKIYVSPGAVDEGGWFFYAELEMSGKEIQSYHDKATGDGGEHEFIRTFVATKEQAFGLIKHASGLLALYMFLEQTGRA